MALRSEALGVAIQALYEAIGEHPDPGATQILTSCLEKLTQVQKLDEQASQSDPRQALIAQMQGGGGGGQGQPQGPPQGAPAY